MLHEEVGSEELKYFPCRYGDSKLVFRGPRATFERPYVSFIGGTETYGKFVRQPFPALVGETRGQTCVNFGFVNAGIDVFVHDPCVIEASQGAQATVIQLIGAQNMSNRFYSVHPRRNDRFVKASALMTTIFRGVDFTDFNFNRHMLSTVLRLAPERFDVLLDELRQAWVARMRTLISRVETPVILLWVAEHAPPDTQVALLPEETLGSDPLFVSKEMIDDVRAGAADYVEVVISDQSKAQRTQGMVFPPQEARVASQMLNERAHHEISHAICGAIDRLKL